MTFEYVRMIKFFKCINLSLKHFFLWFALDSFNINDFNSDWLFIFLIDASVDD